MVNYKSNHKYYTQCKALIYEFLLNINFSEIYNDIYWNGLEFKMKQILCYDDLKNI